MPSAAPWVSPGVNIPLYSIWLPSIAAANSNHCKDAWKTAVLVLNRTSGENTEGGGVTILPTLLMSVIFHFCGFTIEHILLEIVWSCSTQPGTLTGTTCVSLLWHRLDRQKLGSPTVLRWWCRGRCWTTMFPTNSGGAQPHQHFDFCLFGLMWLNLGRLAAHGSVTVCLAHPAPLSPSKHYSSKTRWRCVPAIICISLLSTSCLPELRKVHHLLLLSCPWRNSRLKLKHFVWGCKQRAKCFFSVWLLVG